MMRPPSVSIQLPNKGFQRKSAKVTFLTFLVKVHLKIHVKVHLKVHFLRVWYFLLPRVPPLLFLREGSPLRLFSAIESRITNKKCKSDFFDIFGKSAFKNTCKSAFKSALFESLVLFVTKSPPFAFFKRRVPPSFVFSYRIKDYKQKVQK